MVRWHAYEENKSSERRAARMREAQGRKGGEGRRETTVVDESRKETADRVARHHTPASR